jgi:hypothetical protein
MEIITNKLNVLSLKLLDQFYTKPDIAEMCYNILLEIEDIDEYDYILEPSAGTGSFYNLLPVNNRIGIDVEPKSDGIIKQDFFEYKPKSNNKYLVIGNPPFGKVSSLAVRFFNYAAEFSDCIAFIIPRTFKRVSIQNKLNLNYHLILNRDLDLRPCCFEPAMSAKCCFQIWKRSDIPRELVIYDKRHDNFDFIKHGPKDKNNQPTPPDSADFVMKAYGSNCGEIVDTGLETLRPKSWHWIKSNIDIDELKTRFNSLDYSMSKDTVRQDSIGQQEVIYLYKCTFN